MYFLSHSGYITFTISRPIIYLLCRYVAYTSPGYLPSYVLYAIYTYLSVSISVPFFSHNNRGRFRYKILFLPPMKTIQPSFPFLSLSPFSGLQSLSSYLQSTLYLSLSVLPLHSAFHLSFSPYPSPFLSTFQIIPHFLPFCPF